MAAYALVGVFGTLIGSFLNVVIYRVPQGRSVVAPASACGECGAAIRWYDNIPIVSWLVLRGRCRDCGAAISPRYLLVEALVAVFFVIVALVFLPPVVSAETPAATIAAGLVLLAMLYLASISVALAAIDLETSRLPNVLVLPSYLVLGALLGAAALLAGDLEALLRGAIGLASMGGVYLLLAVFSRGMGMGDVKLAGSIGFALGWLGWSQLAVGWIGGFILGGLVGTLLLVLRRADRKTSIPFGPWLLAGAWIGILLGDPIARGYLALVTGGSWS